VGYDACATLGKTSSCLWVFVVVVSDALITKQPCPGGSKIVLKLGSQVSGVVETGVLTADKQPVALLAKNDWIAQAIPQQFRSKR
jgi:hypothetical protein